MFTKHLEITPVISTEKRSKIGLCVDYRALNEIPKRTHIHCRELMRLSKHSQKQKFFQ